MPLPSLPATNLVETRLSEEGILTIALNRPQKRNAMNVELTLEMRGLLEAVRHRRDIRVVIIRGNGDGFCAGMDIKDFFDSTERSETTLEEARAASNEWRVRLLRHLPQPTIAMVHGFCFGGAFSVVEACDIAFCADNTRFALSEINFGHFPAGPVAKSVSLAMDRRSASYYALSGRTFNGPQAQQSGIVTLSFPADQLEAETLRLAHDLTTKDPIALQFTKESLEHVHSMSWDAALNYNAAKFAELKTLQKGATSRAAAVEGFLDGKFKPGISG